MNYITSLLSKLKVVTPILTQTNRFHALSMPLTRNLITPLIPNCIITRGMKVRYKLRKRCKDCYMLVSHQRTYILCPTHGRHKQMTPVKKPRYTWILTHATQGKIRPY